MITLTDLFCGAGGSSSGAIQVPGVEVSIAANHWRLAVDTHNTNHPNARHDVADLSQVDPRRYPHTDILWASPSCFPAGTLILCRRGLVPIEDVQIGDDVLTHNRRWRPVTSLMSRISDTVIVRGAGHAGIETTGEHPFYVRKAVTNWDNDNRTYRRVIKVDADWVPASDLRKAPTVSAAGEGHFWATPETAEPLLVPEVPGRGVDFTPEFWWMVGRWLGDGMLRIERKKPEPLPRLDRRRSQEPGGMCIICGGAAKQDGRSATGRVSPYCGPSCKQVNKRRTAIRVSRGEVSICCAHDEAEELGARLSAFTPATAAKAVQGELRWSGRKARTAHLYTTGHLGLAEWLRDHFGRYSHGKTMPAWALTMPEEWRKNLLDGYTSADGHRTPRGQMATTVSKSLALGVRLLAVSLGINASLHAPSRRSEGVIEGRPVKMRPLWSVSWTENPSLRHAQTVTDGKFRWTPIKSILPGRSAVEVFNFSVAEDESYVADGIVVHNCTNHSQAQGKKKADRQPDLLGLVLPDEAAERSRATMWDAIRFAEYHRYAAIIVENVVDVRDWELWPAWIAALDALGYEHQVVYLNSMFAKAAGPGAPQSRDRLYVVAWRKGNRAPNLGKWTRPAAWCPVCQHTVTAVQAWKRVEKQRGRYKQQYVWRCPATACRNTEVHPGVLPAAAAIDWSLPGDRIGDRARPLAPKTLARIKAGLAKYGRPIHLEAAGNTFERQPGVRTWPVDEPLKTLHTTASKALAYEPMLVPAGGTWNDSASPVSEPFRTRTTRDTEALAVPAPFIALLRTNAMTHGVDEPLNTVSAGGGHHALVVPVEGREGINARPTSDPARTQTARLQDALVTPPGFVMRNNTARGNPAQMCTPLDEPLRTITTAGHQSLITYDHLLVDYNGPARPVTEPMPTQTTVEGDAVCSIEVDVDDCLFRMLQPHEIQGAMAFAPDYVVLGNQREKVRQLGNAVTPPAARDLVSAVVESLS